jgi:hypothetical protein
MTYQNTAEKSLNAALEAKRRSWYGQAWNLVSWYGIPNHDIPEPQRTALIRWIMACMLLIVTCGTAQAESLASGEGVKIEITATVVSIAGTGSDTKPVQVDNGIGSY